MTDAANTTLGITSLGPFMVNEGATKVADLTALHSDTSNGPLTWSVPPGAAGGADAAKLTLSAAGVLAFGTPKDYEAPKDANLDRTYEVTVQVSDDADSDTADIRVMLLDVDESPVAADNIVTTDEDTAIDINVLDNDSDPEGGALTVSVGREPSDGVAVVNNGLITYTPGLDFNGSDQFGYAVSDGVNSVAAQVSVTVNAVNDPPKFPASETVRTVAETAAAGRPVGAPVAATDVDDSTLVYTRSSADAVSFDIKGSNGQITVGEGTALVAGESYSVTVTATDSLNASASMQVTIDVSEAARPSPPPAQPTIPGVPAIEPVTGSSGAAVVAWTAPANNGGASITAYHLRYIETGSRDKSDANWELVEEVWTTGSGPLKYVLTGLTGATQYDVQVRAVNAAGTGEWSATATTTPPVVPGAPRELKAAVKADEVKVDLSWTAPISDGGAPITGYKVGFSEDGTDPWVEVYTTTDDGVAYTDEGADSNGPMFEVGTTRFYHVSAINSAGTGAPSNVAITEDPLVAWYDANANGTIEKGEVIAAINDYLFGEGDEAISKAEVIELINFYLFGG